MENCSSRVQLSLHSLTDYSLVFNCLLRMMFAVEINCNWVLRIHGRPEVCGVVSTFNIYFNKHNKHLRTD